MPKIYNNKNVFDAAMERMRYIFSEFDNVLVAFSTGKDSGVMLECAYKYATENGLTHKLSIYYQDYEAIFHESTKYAERVFDGFHGCKKKYWLCMPVKASCSVTMMQDGWIPWNKEEKGIWVRDFPQTPFLYTEDNYPYPFVNSTKSYDFRIDFSKDFAAEHGRTAVLVGLRSDESLSRLSIITSNQRVNYYKDKKYSTVINENTVAFYPIYDWTVDDVWIANGKFGFDYNKTYDLYYQAGLSIHEMRIASPFHHCGQAHLRLYKSIDPIGWSKMIGRVNGVNFCGIYGGTTAMGWKSIKKPDHFTWEQYANFLLSTLPEKTRKRYVEKIEKSKWHWRVQGGGRSTEFIDQLEREGWKIRRTGTSSNRCVVNKQKEHVYIDEMMDDTNVDDFRRAPTWKRVCVAILKNDTSCLYMGFSRTKGDLNKRKKALQKYKNI